MAAAADAEAAAIGEGDRRRAAASEAEAEASPRMRRAARRAAGGSMVAGVGEAREWWCWYLRVAWPLAS